jgi:hypothetical protein
MGDLVVLEVCAGFANRVRALVSGICYAEEHRKKLLIHWVPHSTCYAKLDELLYTLSLPSFVRVSSSYLYQEPTMILNDDDLISVPRYIKSYSHFYKKNPERFNLHLRNLRFRVNSITSKSFVGVHIRRTDHTKCINESPLSFFIETMSREPSETRFYLATDCENTKRKILELFKDRVITSEIILKRTSVDGVKGAIIDFVNLANCSKIIGTRYSSFSEMAALYGGVDLILNQTD